MITIQSPISMLYGLMSYCVKLTGEDMLRYYWPAYT